MVREQAADPGSAFPGHGVMKPEQEIERLRCELARPHGLPAASAGGLTSCPRNRQQLKSVTGRG